MWADLARDPKATQLKRATRLGVRRETIGRHMAAIRSTGPCPFLLPEELLALSRPEISTAIAYLWHRNRKTGLAWPGSWTISRITGYAHIVIKRAIRKLRRIGFLEQAGRKPGGTIVYRVLEAARCAIPGRPNKRGSSEPSSTLVVSSLPSVETSTTSRRAHRGRGDARQRLVFALQETGATLIQWAKRRARKDGRLWLLLEELFGPARSRRERGRGGLAVAEIRDEILELYDIEPSSDEADTVVRFLHGYVVAMHQRMGKSRGVTELAMTKWSVPAFCRAYGQPDAASVRVTQVLRDASERQEAQRLLRAPVASGVAA